MALREVVQFPDPRLKQVSAPVEDMTDEIRELARDMIEVMYDEPGIGLAAPQVNISERVIVMDCGRDEAPELYKMINPEIVARSDDRSVLEEGCLSIPHQTAEVERPASVDVRYLDTDGNEQMLHCEALLAACVQHEIDHLDGVLFIDHLSRLKRDMIVRKALKELRQSAASSGHG